ncbi:MAG: DUF4361 domain-containing protein [Muribaculaceae bacterium]|nr:DUF4361 domain-containing protein [Muribaculaceae bacterium]
MKKILLASALVAILGNMSSCNEDSQFQGELYKKVIYVLSDDDLIFQSEHQLGEVSNGYLTLYCGGTEHIQKDVVVEMEFDDTLLDEYNYRNFDLDYSKYAILLPEDHYEIDSFETTLKADSEDNYSLLPIKINPDGLNPDVEYMLPMRIKTISDYELNPDKVRVMLNVKQKNQYASTLTTTYYQTSGHETRHLSTGDVPSTISVTRPVVPVSKNQIRMFAGSHTYVVGSLDPEEVDKYAMTVTLNDDGTLTITPYGSIVIEQLGGPEDNYYFTNNITGYLTLVMNYRYRETLSVNGQDEECWISMIETAVRRTTTTN